MNPIQKILLKKIGHELPTFRQDRYRFYEKHEDFIKVIEVQFLNLPDNKKSFTIHFGIYIPILYKILWDQSTPKSIDASVCTFFCNIDSILSNFNGRPKVRYWDIDEPENLLIEISDIVKVILFPFSQKVSTLEDINALLNTTKFPAKYVATYPILNAILKIVLNRGAEFKALINELKTIDPLYYNPEIDKMMDKAIKYGYPIPNLS